MMDLLEEPDMSVSKKEILKKARTINDLWLEAIRRENGGNSENEDSDYGDNGISAVTRKVFKQMMEERSRKLNKLIALIRKKDQDVITVDQI